MDLQKVTWPSRSILARGKRSSSGGFGGSVQSYRGHYQAFGNPFVAQAEIKQVEEAEAPLPPAAEQEQRERAVPPSDDTNPSLEEAAVKEAEELTQKSASSHYPKASGKDEASPKPKKKRKTLF